MKTCSKCREAKPLESFYSDVRKRDGLHSWCKSCQRESNRQRYANSSVRVCEHARQRYASNPAFREQRLEYNRKWHADPANRWRKREHGATYRWKSKGYLNPDGTLFTHENFHALRERQGDRCAICRRAEPGGPGVWHVDTDHKTKIVRSLLCSSCNLGFGQLSGENSDRVAIDPTLVLVRAALYRERVPFEQLDAAALQLIQRMPS